MLMGSSGDHVTIGLNNVTTVLMLLTPCHHDALHQSAVFALKWIRFSDTGTSHSSSQCTEQIFYCVSKRSVSVPVSQGVLQSKFVDQRLYGSPLGTSEWWTEFKLARSNYQAYPLHGGSSYMGSRH